MVALVANELFIVVICEEVAYALESVYAALPSPNVVFNALILVTPVPPFPAGSVPVTPLARFIVPVPPAISK